MRRRRFWWSAWTTAPECIAANEPPHETIDHTQLIHVSSGCINGLADRDIEELDDRLPRKLLKSFPYGYRFR